MFLFLPLIQSLFKVKGYIRPLKGAYNEAMDVEFNKTKWLDGSFQQGKDNYISQNFGFRNYYVLLNNQLDYELFNKANTDKVVIGKGGFLYESNYITSYFGENFIGEEQLKEKVFTLKNLQDVLAGQNITLQVLLAPGKATYYPEFIPTEWCSTKKINNYECFVNLAKKQGLNYFDCNKWFLEMKNITPYDLYPKTGIHWSNYGSLIAFDSLTKRIENETKLNLKNLEITNVAFQDSLISPDEDIGNALNLAFKIQPLPMPYAKYNWISDSTEVHPRALFIGDSYFWNMYYEGLVNNVFDKSAFWYYNQTVYPESEPEREVKKLNLAEEIKKFKVIVLLVTDCNIHDIGWGFAETASKLLTTEMKAALRRNIYILDLCEEIKRTPDWLIQVEKKAKEKNISVEAMIKLDAVYAYETDYNQPEVISLTEQNKKRILDTPEWVNQIKAKAKEKNISFEEMLELDAKYIYNTEQRKK